VTVPKSVTQELFLQYPLHARPYAEEKPDAHSSLRSWDQFMTAPVKGKRNLISSFQVGRWRHESISRAPGLCP